jgi:AcrR family transcriptional regulator
MIVAAAREIDPSTLTLQAVALRLGVDRKAITYHVSGLDELTALVAAENLADELADLDLSGGAWQDAVRTYAVATRDTLLRTPTLAMVIERIPGAGVLRPVDALAGRLFDAGFDEAVTGRAVSIISTVVFAGARDILLARTYGEEPITADVRRILGGLPDDDLVNIRRMLDVPGLEPRSDREQWFDLDLVVAGLEALLARQG